MFRPSFPLCLVPDPNTTLSDIDFGPAGPLLDPPIALEQSGNVPSARLTESAVAAGDVSLVGGPDSIVVPPETKGGSSAAIPSVPALPSHPLTPSIPPCSIPWKGLPLLSDKEWKSAKHMHSGVWPEIGDVQVFGEQYYIEVSSVLLFYVYSFLITPWCRNTVLLLPNPVTSVNMKASFATVRIIIPATTVARVRTLAQIIPLVMVPVLKKNVP